MRYLLLTLAWLMVSQPAVAQVFTEPLRVNGVLERAAQQAPKKQGERKDSLLGEPLSLPFVDDFSSISLHPDDSLYLPGSPVYINNHFALGPLSKNYATLDGQKRDGRPYNFRDLSARGLADSLVSRPIDLSEVESPDSLYLSFYWQAGGDASQLSPDSRDSLVLQFRKKISDDTVFIPNTGFDTAGNFDTLSYDTLFGRFSWVNMWDTTGVDNVPFQQEWVKVPLPEGPDTLPTFLYENFQFRFYNYGNLAGNFDVWHIDYLHLDQGRHPSQDPPLDLAWADMQVSPLKTYSQMPFSHFYPNPARYLKDTITGTLFNIQDRPGILADSVRFTFSEDQNGQVLDQMRSTAADERITNDEIALAPQSPRKLTANLNKTAFVKTLQGMSGPANLRSTFEFLGNDFPFTRGNNTLTRFTSLNKYYAYDDGSAELARGVAGVNSFLAVRYEIQEPDTLRGISIHFPKSQFNVENELIGLNVWDEIELGTGNANSLRFQTVAIRYRDGVNGFTDFLFDQPLFLDSGTYYFGYKQITPNADVPVGADINAEMPPGSLLYNSDGEWRAFQRDNHALMIRPFFGCRIPEVSIALSEDSVLRDTVNDKVSGFQWFRNGEPLQGANKPSFKPKLDGIYTLEATNFCGDTVRSSFEIRTPTALPGSAAPQGAWRLAPNPASEQLRLQPPESYKGPLPELQARNLAGQPVPLPVLSREGAHMRLDVSGLKPGFYLLGLYFEGKPPQVLKFLKE